MQEIGLQPQCLKALHATLNPKPEILNPEPLQQQDPQEKDAQVDIVAIIAEDSPAEH